MLKNDQLDQWDRENFFTRRPIWRTMRGGTLQTE